MLVLQFWWSNEERVGQERGRDLRECVHEERETNLQKRKKELLKYVLKVEVNYSAYVHFLKYKNLDVWFFLGVLLSTNVKI